MPSLAERIVVLDKATFPRDKICAGAIGRRADRLLAEIGVEIDVPAATVSGFHVRASGGELSATRPEAIGRVVRRREFDAALLARVENAGVAVRDGTRVRGLVRRSDRVELDTSDGPLTATAVVGADGVGSIVRRQLGFARGHYHAQVVEVDTDPVDADVSRALLSFDIRDRGLTGYAWDFPTVVEGEELVCRGIYALTRGIDAPRCDPSRALRERIERQGARVRGPFKRFAERGLSLYEPLAVDRVLLVGEAGGIDPVLGEGIPQAIFYGKTAAAYLAQCVRSNDYRFTTYRRAMRSARIGTDLRVRAALFELVYGRTRPWVERWVTRSRAISEAGMAYFAGDRVPRSALARALADLVGPF